MTVPAGAETGMAAALAEARLSLEEGGLPVGAVLMSREGAVLGRGRNRVTQSGDPLLHAEIVAFRDAPARARYTDCVMVTTAEPCWLCSGLIRQFGIGTVVIGASSDVWGAAWLHRCGIDVVHMPVVEAEEHLRLVERIEMEHQTWAAGSPPQRETEGVE